MKSSTFILENLGCAGCAAKMEQKISKIAGVKSASVVFQTKQLRIEAQSIDEIMPKIKNIVNSLEPDVVIVPKGISVADKEGECSCGHEHGYEEEHGHSHEHGNSGSGKISLIIGICLFALGILLNAILKSDISGYLSFGLFLAAYILLGLGTIKTAIKNISKGQIFDENFLMLIATAGAFIIGDYPEAAAVMLFFRVGTYFEEVAVEKSRKAIMGAVDMRPEKVTIILDGIEKEIAAEKAKEGDVIIVKAGERVGLDCTVLSGQSNLDTVALTGESVPVPVKMGDSVLSGSININGALTLKVDKPLSQSTVTRIMEAMESAVAAKPRLDRFITRFARVYTPIVVGLAVAMAIIPPLFMGGGFEEWIYKALLFLVISCPCALVLSVPLAFFAGIGKGSKQGILFKNGSTLEGLAAIKAVVMDKTGTLTKGVFEVTKIIPNGIEKKELLTILATAQYHSTHPIAHSLLAAAKKEGIEIAPPIRSDEIAGKGISATTEKGTIVCGNKALMTLNNIAIDEEGEGTVVYGALNGKYIGRIEITDIIKPTAQKALLELKKKGMYTAMLTGDNQKAAAGIAAQLGIDEVKSGLLPQGKLEALKSIREKRGAVMFVGDGINDSVVLAGADVGAAMGSGSDIAIEAADVVFMNSSVEAIPNAIDIAKRTKTIAIQNISIALIIKLGIMVLNLMGMASMWWAVFADTGVTLICVLNALRLLKK